MTVILITHLYYIMEVIKSVNMVIACVCDEGDRKMAVDEALEQGHKFTATIDDKLLWLSSIQDKLASCEPISADKDTLARQTSAHKACFSILLSV